MCCDGVFGGARPTVAIFADTGDEPADTYLHLAQLEADFGHVIPIHKVSLGYSLSEAARRSIGGRMRWPAIPLHVRNKDGDGGMLRRHCTREFKVEPIQKEIRRMLAKGMDVGMGSAGGLTEEAWLEFRSRAGLEELLFPKVEE